MSSECNPCDRCKDAESTAVPRHRPENTTTTCSSHPNHLKHWKTSEDIRVPLLTRLPFRGRHLSYQRSRHTTHAKTSLIKIEGVDSTESAKYVLSDWPRIPEE